MACGTLPVTQVDRHDCETVAPRACCLPTPTPQSVPGHASGFVCKLADFGLAKVLDPTSPALPINRTGAGGSAAAAAHSTCSKRSSPPALVGCHLCSPTCSVAPLRTTSLRALLAPPSNNAGTVTYLAPEMFVRGAKITPAVDVYAFGIIMWEVRRGPAADVASKGPGSEQAQGARQRARCQGARGRAARGQAAQAECHMNMQ